MNRSISKKIMIQDAHKFAEELRRLRDRTPLNKSRLGQIAQDYDNLAKMLEESPHSLKKLKADLKSAVELSQKEQERILKRLEAKGLTWPETRGDAEYSEARKQHIMLQIPLMDLTDFYNHYSKIQDRKKSGPASFGRQSLRRGYGAGL